MWEVKLYDLNWFNLIFSFCRISKHLVFFMNFALLLFGVAVIVISFFRNPDLNFLGSDSVDSYFSISLGVLVVIIGFLGCSGATTQTVCIISLYILLSIITALLCLSFIIFTQTSSWSTVMSTYSQHRWDAFSSSEREEYESNHDCNGYDECKNVMRDNLENDAKLLNLVCIIVICIQMVMVSIGCVLITKLSKNKSKDSSPMWWNNFSFFLSLRYLLFDFILFYIINQHCYSQHKRWYNTHILAQERIDYFLDCSNSQHFSSHSDNFSTKSPKEKDITVPLSDFCVKKLFKSKSTIVFKKFA